MTRVTQVSIPKPRQTRHEALKEARGIKKKKRGIKFVSNKVRFATVWEAWECTFSFNVEAFYHARNQNEYK